MKMTLMVALLAISATPQDQPNVAKLKADAENPVEIVGSDKHKYCEFAELSDQIGEANPDEDQKGRGVISKDK